jgi:succinoglycan biosynthesis protein ExoM
MNVAVCIATFKRAEGLERLLVSLLDQKGADGKFGLIVVDNDASASAQSVVDRFSNHGIPIIYAVEPEPGIPAARNRSVALARSEAASALAFIDDDEVASPYWVSTMYARLQISGADAISGPVEPIFPTQAPKWARESRLYHRSTFLDGASIDYASTANSMIRTSAIAGVKRPFSPAFRFTGGSDTHLYQSIRARGGSIIWEPAGLVYEHVPNTRLSMSWVVQRGYRHGITLSRCDRLIESRRKVFLRAVRGTAQIPAGALQIGVSLVRKNQDWRRGAVRVARGVGTIAGLLGKTYDEYARADGA